MYPRVYAGSVCGDIVALLFSFTSAKSVPVKVPK